MICASGSFLAFRSPPLRWPALKHDAAKQVARVNAEGQRDNHEVRQGWQNAILLEVSDSADWYAGRFGEGGLCAFRDAQATDALAK